MNTTKIVTVYIYNENCEMAGRAVPDGVLVSGKNSGGDWTEFTDTPANLAWIQAHFECEQCGECCRIHTVGVRITRQEAERLARLCARSQGFVYGVNLMGVTGERTSLAESAGVLALVILSSEKRLQKVQSRSTSSVSFSFGT